jgi:hypothetical protein
VPSLKNASLRLRENKIAMPRIIALVLGIVISAWGGVISYRALFLEQSTTAVIDSGSGTVHEYPDLLRVVFGCIMLFGGAAIAFFAARRKSM